MQKITPGRPNSYTGGSFERAQHRREDEPWIAAARQNPASRAVLFWRGKPMIGGLAEGAPQAVLAALPDDPSPWVFLGVRDHAAIFAVDISAREEPGNAVADMWLLTGALPENDAVMLATARAMLHWRERNGFCAVCGNRNRPIRAGYVLACESCGAQHFPRTDPAVIMLVTKGERILLGQSHRFPVERNFFSTLAGFVEPGESLEDAVRREVLEEVGVRIGDVMYHSSQPWPFPASLMLGYYAQALSEEIVLEAAEMRDAKWFSREDIANRSALGFELPPQTSIARRLIEDWLEQG